MQTKKGSLVEAILNIASGFIISMILTMYLTNYPIKLGDYDLINFSNGFGAQEAFNWTLLMTVISVVRSYIWRRYFNKLIVRRMYENN